MQHVGDLEVKPLAVSRGVEVRAEVELVVGVGDPDGFLQVAALEPALKHQAVGREAGSDGGTEGVSGTAPRHGATEVVDLVVWLVVVHHPAVLLPQRPRHGLLPRGVVENLRGAGETLDVADSVRQHLALARPPDDVVTPGARRAGAGAGAGRLAFLQTFQGRPGGLRAAGGNLWKYI